ncbi:hypothetical protein CsatA_009148 [Cannabis sativa]
MSKAYDRIEWSFLEAMLLKMGFTPRWIGLIMSCVSSANYKVIHGCHEMGPINPTRGIRQGDPLSPYLFILCAEGLSSLLRKYEHHGYIHGCKVANGAPRVSHMLFADDSYLYCKATLEESRCIQELLRKFELASGQQVNLAKSSIFFSGNTTPSVRSQVCTFLNVSEAAEGSFYLGLPSTISRNKTIVLGFLKDKVRKRIQGWEGKFLSRAGKEILVKTVLQSLPTYAMSVFLLPLEISREIERMMTKFWWQTSKNSQKGIHWMAWDKLSKNKKGGGLGFRDLRDFNLAMLGKQGWRLMSRPDSLASKVFKARYYNDGSFLTAQLGSNPSFVWRSILEAQDLVRRGIRWCVGNGQSISVLGEPWLPDANNPLVTSSHPTLASVTVASLMSMDNGGWDNKIIEDLFEVRDQQLIKSIPLQAPTALDRMYWTLEKSGIFSVKSAYSFLQKDKGYWYDDQTASFWNKLWSLKVPPKIANLLWRACTECLPTLVQLRIKKVVSFVLCPLCQTEEESTLHSLVTCTVVQQCWNRVGIGTSATPDMSFLQWCSSQFQAVSGDQQCLIAVVCWAVWGARNNLVWQKKLFNPVNVVAFATKYLDQWKNARNSNLDTSRSDFQFGDGNEHWTPPNGNSIKINVDAALFDGGHKYGLGMVARDRNGFLIEARTVFSHSSVDPPLAEAIGLKEALSWIKEMQWQNAQLESDCLGAIQAIRSSLKMLFLFGLVIHDCKTLINSIGNVSVSFCETIC